MARIGNNQLLLDPVNQGLRDRWNRDTAFTNTVANNIQNVFTGADKMVSGYKKWQDEQEMNKLRDSLSKSDASKMQNIELQKELDALQAVEERRRKYMPGYTGEIGKNNAERMAKINKLQSDIELNKSSILTDDQALLNMNKLASMGDPSYYNAYLQRRAEQNRAADDAYRDNQLKLEEINRQNEELKAAEAQKLANEELYAGTSDKIDAIMGKKYTNPNLLTETLIDVKSNIRALKNAGIDVSELEAKLNLKKEEVQGDAEAAAKAAKGAEEKRKAAEGAQKNKLKKRKKSLEEKSKNSKK